MKVLLIGQPNVGKSSLINALTGAKVMVSNYPGTTIDIIEGKVIKDGVEYVFVDTPGIYSLFPSSLEEKITDEIVLNGDYDFVIQVIDAISLERSLVITMSLIELGIPLILAINFWEDAEKKGIEINFKKLEEMLGIKVVKINPIKKNGIKELEKNLREAKKSDFNIIYDDDIEYAIQKTMELVERVKLSKRGVAVKILEGDEIAIKKYGVKKDEIVKIERHPNLSRDIQITKSGYASIIAKNVTNLRKKEERMNSIDNFLFSNWIMGAIFSILTFFAIFFSLIYIGGWFQDTLTSLFQPIIESVAKNKDFWSIVLKQSLIGVAAGISIAIPYIGIFYIILAIMEDSGILARFIIILNRIFKKIGLPGKAIIPIMLGLGCSVAAMRSSRILASREDRIKVAFLFSFVPCSSRAAIIFGVVAHFAGILYAAGIYIISFALFIITAKLLNVVIKKEPMPIIEELPPYRIPKMKNVLIKSWMRMKSFVYIVIPLLIAGGFAYGLLLNFNLVNLIVAPLKPLTMGWMMLPPKSIIALFYGFIQKDLTMAMLANSLGTLNFGAVMSKLQIFTFGMASSFQIPCIIAFGMIIKELGWKNAIIIEISALLYGLFMTGLILRLLLLF